MKKVIGLFLVILISSVSVFAQSGKRGGQKGDPSKRIEQMVTDLKLDDKQAAEFRKIQKEYAEKMKKERDAAQNDRTKMREKMKQMNENKNAEIKKILSDEQYKQYLEKLQSMRSRNGNGRR